ncbi:hypothetical protein V1478_002840 [Vespula squamosa]|uniref:Uncharacterized protein n=1 Tax=Vespula squamosa TaxID=30214 RepID=A0ABD2BQZ5_VESSQ
MGGKKGVSRRMEGGSREKRRRDAETPRRGCRAPNVLDSSGPMTAMFVGRNGKRERNTIEFETIENTEKECELVSIFSSYRFFQLGESMRTVCKQN